MGDKAQSIHLVAVEQQVHLHQITGTVIRQFIVQRGITPGFGFQGIEEIVNNLVQGHIVPQLHQIGVQILHILVLTPLILAHGHNVAHIFLGRDDGNVHIRLPRLGNHRRVGVIVGVVHVENLAVGFHHLVNYGGQGGHQIQIEFPLQALLNNLHVEHSQKAAAETKAQSHRGFRLIGQRRVVQFQLVQGVPQIRVLGAVSGINAAVHHGLRRTIAGQGFRRRGSRQGHRVAHLRIGNVFDACSEIANIAGGQLLAGHQTFRLQMAHLHHLIFCAGGHKQHFIVFFHPTVHQTHQNNYAPIAVILAVENQGFQRCVRIALGCRYVLHNVLHHRPDIDASFGADFRRVHGGNADDVLNLVLHPQRVRRRQINFVQHRQNFQIVVQCQIGIGKGLRLHALRGVYDQQGALAGCQRPGNLVVEVHMTRGVDQIQSISFSVICLVIQTDGAGFDGDAPFPLQIHIIQDLVFHLPLFHRAAQFNNAVRQRTLAVVNMGDDGKIPNVFLVDHRLLLSGRNSVRAV